MKKSFLINIFLILTIQLFSQSLTKKDALNNLINFANESTHGLLIVHRLLENYNQEINKYVDLPGYKINNISNNDLPRNIFKDEDHWFYTTTPYQCFGRIKKDKKTIGANDYEKIFPIAKNLVKTCNKINNIRFKIADLISTTDLNIPDNLNNVYILLEEAVDLFDLFFAYELNLENEIQNIYSTQLNSPLEKHITGVYHDAIKLLFSIRIKDELKIKQNLADLKTEFSGFKNFISSSNPSKKVIKIAASIKDIISSTNELLNTPTVSKEYTLYEKFYFYYNIKIIDKYNRYGNGFVYDMNEIIKKKNFSQLYKFEFPHYFKVIYPKKVEKKIETIKSISSNIVSVPKKLKNRAVKHSNIQKIIVDDYYINLEFFDYKIQDGDIVSINFNGDWIYKKLSLETKPKEVKLKLNKTGKNYIILHAINVGRRPPNTIGIRYTYQGEKKTIILESDLRSSDVVEFEIKK